MFGGSFFSGIVKAVTGSAIGKIVATVIPFLSPIPNLFLDLP